MNLRAARLSSHEPVQRRSQPYKCLQVMLRTGDIFWQDPSPPTCYFQKQVEELNRHLGLSKGLHPSFK